MRKEFRNDIKELGLPEGEGYCVKPLEEGYVRYLHTEHGADLEYDQGRDVREGSNNEAARLPYRVGWIAGARLNDLFLKGKTDLTLEYADNVISEEPGLWYSNFIYRSGYTYEGEIIGHHMVWFLFNYGF